MRFSRPLSALFALGMATCASIPSHPAEVNCVTPSVNTLLWVRVSDSSGFSFLLPRGYRENAVVPVDSHVRGFEADGWTLSLDYGKFSDDHRGAADPSDAHLECPAVIGGHPAVVVLTWPDRMAYNVDASWRDVRPGVHLWMGGAASTPENQRALLTVLRSVQFTAQ